MRDTGHPMLAIPAAGQASCGLVDALFKTEKIRISRCLLSFVPQSPLSLTVRCTLGRFVSSRNPALLLAEKLSQPPVQLTQSPIEFHALRDQRRDPCKVPFALRLGDRAPQLPLPMLHGVLFQR
jgi:hypothetical protein